MIDVIVSILIGAYLATGTLMAARIVLMAINNGVVDRPITSWVVSIALAALAIPFWVVLMWWAIIQDLAYEIRNGYIRR